MDKKPKSTEQQSENLRNPDCHCIVLIENQNDSRFLTPDQMKLEDEIINLCQIHILKQTRKLREQWTGERCTLW